MTDYNVTMQDASGRTCVLFISEESLREQLAAGLSLEDAKEGLETNAFWHAVGAGQIAEQAWVIARNA